MAKMGSIAERWKELSGQNKWEGLLDPLDADLRRYIIHYGERVQAVRDAFNFQTTSKWYGFSRYPPDSSFFSKLGLEKGNPFKYKVTKFFYARSEIEVLHWVAAEDTSWMGYVAVVTEEGKAALGRRDILVAWRGTRTIVEAVKDVQVDFVPAGDVFGSVDGNPKVHHGWHSVYTSESSESLFSKFSARKQVLAELRRLVDLYGGEEISITVAGHSLGGAVAILNAADVVTNGYNKPTDNPEKACLVTAIAFGSPRVGNALFSQVISGLPNLHILRISNAADMVPSVPPPLLYEHVGEELRIDTRKSPYLKSGELVTTMVVSHLMDMYLHGVAGTPGPDGEFKLEVKRDISLLNKFLDVLKDEYRVPVKWWVEKNKGMVQQEDGSWKLLDYEPCPPTNLE